MSTSTELEQYRQQIDTLDDQIVALLKERLNIVTRVGEYKRETAPAAFPIRSGREARMVRRITESFAGSTFSPAAAAQIWRIIIGTSTALESRLSISVFAPEKDDRCFWLAREYFGPEAIITRQPHVKRVVGDVMDKTAAVGVMPVFSRDDDTHAWSHLVQSAADAPKIFAHLPFTYAREKPRHFPAAFAFSSLMPEASGDDRSLYALDVAHDVSQHRLQTAFHSASLRAEWIATAPLSTHTRRHMIDVAGFVAPDSAPFRSFADGLGGALQRISFLGAYAVPFTIT